MTTISAAMIPTIPRYWSLRALLVGVSESVTAVDMSVETSLVGAGTPMGILRAHYGYRRKLIGAYSLT